MYQDLRDWLQIVDGMGQLARLDGAHWDLEIGAITDMVAKHPGNKPALLFDNIAGYPRGFRVLTSSLNSMQRLALTCNLPPEIVDLEFVRTWARRFKSLQPVAPREVKSGPVLENVLEGGRIDLWRFPAPRWHDLDGGRYIGTAPLIITRDPETGLVNVGCYRVMVYDERSLGVLITSNHHGAIQRQKWFERGKPCPVAISFGHDPLLFMLAGTPVPATMSEYDIAGGVKGGPIDVIRGPETGLPIPATAEIALEGYFSLDERRPEGPFGEFTGYYASGVAEEPVLKVTRLMHRHDPILLGSPRGRPPDDPTFWQTRMKASSIWEGLIAAGVPDVQGVWCHHPNSNLFTVVSIKQRYAGHARQAGLIAQLCGAASGAGKWLVVVDEDIDPSSIDDVLWAIGTRADPERAIEINRYTSTTPLESSRPPWDRVHMSRCLIEACRPWEWKDKFPIVAETGPELAKQVKDKWSKLIFRNLGDAK
jgi:UbiD family decarboxylase